MADEPRITRAYAQDDWTAEHLQKALTGMHLERALPQEATPVAAAPPEAPLPPSPAQTAGE